jgi:hypothetical protein
MTCFWGEKKTKKPGGRFRLLQYLSFILSLLPVTFSLLHCVALDRSVQCRYISFASDLVCSVRLIKVFLNRGHAGRTRYDSFSFESIVIHHDAGKSEIFQDAIKDVRLSSNRC